MVNALQKFSKDLTESTLMTRHAQVNEGVIVAVGPGRRDDSGALVPMDVKEGDTVVLPDYGGHSLKLEGKE